MTSTERMLALFDEIAADRKNRHLTKAPKLTAAEKLRQRAQTESWIEPICEILNKCGLLVTDINRLHEPHLRIRFKNAADPASPKITLVANQSGDFSLFPDPCLMSPENTAYGLASQNIKDYLWNIHTPLAISREFGLPVGIAHKLFLLPNLFLLAKSVLRCQEKTGLGITLHSVALHKKHAEMLFVSSRAAELAKCSAQEAPAVLFSYSYTKGGQVEIVNVGTLSQRPDIQRIYAPVIAQVARTSTAIAQMNTLFPPTPEARGMKCRVFSKLWTLPYLVCLGKMGIRMEGIQIREKTAHLQISGTPQEGTPFAGQITIRHKQEVSGTPATSEHPLHDEAFFAVVAALEEGMNPSTRVPTEPRQPAMGAFSLSGCGSAQERAIPA